MMVKLLKHRRNHHLPTLSLILFEETLGFRPSPVTGSVTSLTLSKERGAGATQTAACTAKNEVIMHFTRSKRGETEIAGATGPAVYFLTARYRPHQRDYRPRPRHLRWVPRDPRESRPVALL